MLRWSIVFLVISLIAAFFGFGGIANVSADMARIVFFLFIVGFVVTLVLGMTSRKRLI